MKWKLFIIILTFLFIIPIVSAADIDIGDGSHTLSRGSELILTGATDGVSKSGWVWIFGYGGEGSVYSKPITVVGGEFIARVPETKNLVEGDYIVIVQLSGKNNIQEVTHTYDIYNYDAFNSPWKNVSATKISLNPNVARLQLYNLTGNTTYSDDKLLDYNLHIEPAFITFDNMYIIQNDQKNILLNGRMYLGGSTNLETYDRITVMVDYTENETYYASIDYRGVGYRTWHTEINVSRKKAGTHYITIESDKTNKVVNTFTISEYIPTPKPTPTPIKYVSDEFRTVPEVTYTLTPTITPVVHQTAPKFVPIDTPQEAPPGSIMIKPVGTNIVNKPVNLSATPAASPINPLLPIIGLIIIGCVVLVKRDPRK